MRQGQAAGAGVQRRELSFSPVQWESPHWLGQGQGLSAWGLYICPDFTFFPNMHILDRGWVRASGLGDTPRAGLTGTLAVAVSALKPTSLQGVCTKERAGKDCLDSDQDRAGFKSGQLPPCVYTLLGNSSLHLSEDQP